MSKYTLSSLPPLGAIIGAEPVTLLVGVEDNDDGSLRAYLGSRSLRTYLTVDDPEAQQAFRRAWANGGHVWLWPVPPAELLSVDEVLPT